jgi:hypothetical protein
VKSLSEKRQADRQAGCEKTPLPLESITLQKNSPGNSLRSMSSPFDLFCQSWPMGTFLAIVWAECAHSLRTKLRNVFWKSSIPSKLRELAEIFVDLQEILYFSCHSHQSIWNLYHFAKFRQNSIKIWTKKAHLRYLQFDQHKINVLKQKTVQRHWKLAKIGNPLW